MNGRINVEILTNGIERTDTMESFVISVSLGTGCYRHIQISANATLFKLHQAILKAFEFDDDHLHAFFMDNKRWSDRDMYVAFKSEPADRLTKKYSLQRAGLVKGKKFLYLFDFGDEWVFQCRVLRELEDKTATPVIIRSVGESPEQYPSCDDWDEDDWDEDDLEVIKVINPKERYQEQKPQEEQNRRLLDLDEVDEEWPDFDYEGFPKLYPISAAFEEFEKLPIPIAKVFEIAKYFDAAARLYGVIPLRKLLEIYNKHNNPISSELFLKIAEILRHQYRLFSILNCEALKQHAPMDDPLDWEIVAQYVYESDIDDYYAFVQLQGEKPYCILPKADFLRYANPNYFPKTAQAKQMRQFLLSVTESQDDAEELLFDLREMIALDLAVEDILDILAEEGLQFESKKELNSFLSLYQELNNHSRKCVNRGYTPSELARILPIDGQISLFDDPVPTSVPQTVSGTPARNTPCPCGSGRKYKKCCGKKVILKS